METTTLLLQIYFALLGAYLSVVMARVLKQNGRVLKKMDEGFTMMSTKMDKMDQGLTMLGTKIDEGFRRMDRGFELIAKLIVEENERTRKGILESLAKS